MASGPDPEKLLAIKRILELAFPDCPVCVNPNPANINPEFTFPYDGTSRKVIVARKMLDDSSAANLEHMLIITIQRIRQGLTEVMLG